MFIAASAINNWRDLQNKVSFLFREMGYYTETPRIVDLAGRGQKEVDVYVRDDRASVNQIILIECKNWSSRVTREVVHAMWTVMEGSGANTGFIISKKGFQRGAQEAIANTNIHLLTWEDLQHTFGKQWLAFQTNRLAPVVAELRGIDSLHLDQWETSKAIMNNMPFEKTGKWKELFDLLIDIRVVLFAAMAQPSKYDQKEPINVNVYEGFPGAIRDEYGTYGLPLSSVRSFYKWIIPYAESLLRRYRDLSARVRHAFDSLSDDEVEASFARSLVEIRGEMPIRVFRDLLGDEEYFSLLARKFNTKRKVEGS